MALKFHSTKVRSLNYSKTLSKDRVILTLEMLDLRLESCDCHALMTLLKFLNLAVRACAGSE